MKHRLTQAFDPKIGPRSLEKGWLHQP